MILSSTTSRRGASPEGYSLIADRAKKNLIDFEIATNERYDPNWHHEIIARELEKIEAFGDRDYKILLIVVSPRHGKSQQCSIDFPAWFLGRNPTKEIITASYSGDLAQEFSGKTREKVGSEAYQRIFSDVRLREDERARDRWRTEQGGSYTAVGIGGSLTGRGANVLLIDDPIKNREEAESDTFRKRTWEWFVSTAFTRLEPNGVAIVILTRWHTDDLAGRILALKERVKMIHFPAVAEYDEARRKKGDALWPARYPIDSLREIKATIGPYEWSALYQGVPITSETQEFKPEWMRRITEREVEMMNVRRFLTIDTAMSKKAQADYTGFCDNRVNRENFWHLSAWRVRLGAEELVDTIFSLHTAKKYEKIGIEKTSYLDGLKPYLDSEQRRRNIFLPIVPMEHKQAAKEIRIRGLIPRYSAGSVFHIENECKALEEEQAQFPFGTHDDVLDATAYQIQLVSEADKIRNNSVYQPQWKGYNRMETISSVGEPKQYDW